MSEKVLYETRVLTIPDIRDRFAAYYMRNPVWGSLHIVLEDGNINDSHVRSCIARALETDDKEGAELGRLLLMLSKSQRLKLYRMKWAQTK